VVDIDESVVTRLLANKPQSRFSEAFRDVGARAQTVGAGDVLEITIWETPPATLFGAVTGDLRVAVAAVPTTLPAQMVDREGTIGVPFAGRVKAAGLTPADIGTAIINALKNKANQPQVLVRVAQNTSSTVTVVGEVAANVRMPLTAGGERVLDALAAAGGVKQPVGKVSLQLTRGDRLQTMPLETIIRDPRQNIPLQPGDVLTALYQPLSFTALGATGRQDEVPFESQGISLAQAMGRMGGLLDNRADPHGVFIFRFEPKAALDWPQQPIATTPDGMVPVVYRLNLSDPRSFFAMQSFTMHHRDLVYVSNAPAAELQKFLNMVFSAVYPVVNLVNATR
jgi:polysaccharide export outer membrane protein